jgi:hypothetical protein
MIHVHVTIENISKEVAVTVKIWTIFQTSSRLVKKKTIRYLSFKVAA